VEYFRVPQRHSGFELLPSGIRQRQQIVQHSFGHTDRERTMEEWQKMCRRFVERSGQTRRTRLQLEKIRFLDDRVVQHDVMASGILEPHDLPGVLDLPVARRQQETANPGPPAIIREGFSVLGHDAKAGQPVGVLAAAGKRPAPIDPPAGIGRFGRPDRSGGAR
jgi:hypothetical protein